MKQIMSTERPCRGRKPFGFSSRCETCPPILAEESAAGRQNTVMRRLCFPCGVPLRGAKTSRVFIPS
ncbi:MAG: hypothetical protein LBK61_07555 [Spirochaetaceae bacterium]|nr:hypothetical protein [Spirochaetaceae bacterium]